MNDKIKRTLVWYDKKLSLLEEEIAILKKEIKTCDGYLSRDHTDYLMHRIKHESEIKLDIAVNKEHLIAQFIDILIKIGEE